jgi:hypothetical protein
MFCSRLARRRLAFEIHGSCLLTPQHRAKISWHAKHGASRRGAGLALAERLGAMMGSRGRYTRQRPPRTRPKIRLQAAPAAGSLTVTQLPVPHRPNTSTMRRWPAPYYCEAHRSHHHAHHLHAGTHARARRQPHIQSARRPPAHSLARAFAAAHFSSSKASIRAFRTRAQGE